MTVFIKMFNDVLVTEIETLRLKRQAFDTQWQSSLSEETYRRKQGSTGRKSAEYMNKSVPFIIYALYITSIFLTMIALLLDVLVYLLFYLLTILCIRLQASVSHRECYHRWRYIRNLPYPIRLLLPSL